MDAREDHEHVDPPWVPVPGMSLAEQAEMFGSIAMSSPTGVVASDLQGRITWVNPVAESMFGWSRDELLGRPFTVLVPPGAHDRILEIRSRILSGEQTAPFLAQGLRRDGQVFDISATPGVRRDGQGHPLGTNMMLRDVTEELRLQRELAEALARSRARFDQSARPQALLDIEGRFVEVNDAGCDLLGWAREELLGRDATEIIHPSDPDQVRDQLDRLRRGELRAATYATSGLRKDGSRVPLQIDITAVRDENGRAYEFAAFARDLTELREAQRRLASQEAFFRGLNRESSDATVVADAEGRILYLTPSTAQILGYEPDDLLNMLGEEVVHPDDLARSVDLRRRVRTVPGARARFALRLRETGGGWRWFDATVTNCVDDPDIGWRGRQPSRHLGRGRGPAGARRVRGPLPRDRPDRSGGHHRGLARRGDPLRQRPAHRDPRHDSRPGVRAQLRQHVLRGAGGLGRPAPRRAPTDRGPGPFRLPLPAPPR